MDITTTTIILLFAIIGFVFASWRAARPTIFGKVRLMPWLEISIALAVVAILMLVHFLTLFGLKKT